MRNFTSFQNLDIYLNFMKCLCIKFPDSQIRIICCHFAVTYSAFDFIKLKQEQVSTNCLLFWYQVKSSLEFSKLFASCYHACMACRQFAVNVTSLLFLNVYSYNFVNLWNLFAILMLTQFTLDFNDSKLSTSWKQYTCINLFHMLNLAWLSGLEYYITIVLFFLYIFFIYSFYIF